MFWKYCQTTLPVFSSRQVSASCVLGPGSTVAVMPCPAGTSPTRLSTYTYPFMTIGQDIPPTSDVQARFSPSGDHLSGKFFSRLTPSCSGPRHFAQSLANAGAAEISPASAQVANWSFIGVFLQRRRIIVQTSIFG